MPLVSPKAGRPLLEGRGLSRPSMLLTMMCASMTPIVFALLWEELCANSCRSNHRCVQFIVGLCRVLGLQITMPCPGFLSCHDIQ